MAIDYFAACKVVFLNAVWMGCDLIRLLELDKNPAISSLGLFLDGSSALKKFQKHAG
jgi:hypothetical protein